MVIVNLMGGLGNQMFQYAMGRMLSQKLNTELLLNSEYYEYQKRTGKGGILRAYDLDIFGLNLNRNERELNKIHGISWFDNYFFNKSYSKKYMTVKEKAYFYSSEILSFPYPPNIILSGFWQSWKYFSEIESIIRKDFTQIIDPEASEELKDLIDEMSNENSVCVSVRRGDYIGDKKYAVCDTNYFNRAKRILEEHSSNSMYYMFSDDPEWCKHQFSDWKNLKHFNERLQGDKYRNKFLAMRSCKHFIIPNSTFPWWAAWLGNYPGKIVLAPENWFVNGTVPYKLDDLYPSNWKRVPAL